MEARDSKRKASITGTRSRFASRHFRAERLHVLNRIEEGLGFRVSSLRVVTWSLHVVLTFFEGFRSMEVQKYGPLGFIGYRRGIQGVSKGYIRVPC